jgi:hypothetical protein
MPNDSQPLDDAELIDPYPTLSLRHQRFVQALIDTNGNQTQAYIKAGYSPEGANVNASRLLANDRAIQLAYERKKVELSVRSQLPREKWLAELKSIGMLSKRQAKQWIASGVKVSLRDKVVGLQTLGKACGWLDEKRTFDSKQLILANVQIIAPHTPNAALEAHLEESSQLGNLTLNVTPQPPKLSEEHS